MAITLDLSTLEAHLVLGALNRERLEASKLAAEAKHETVREYHDVSAQVLARVETAMCDAMFPETVEA